MAWANSKIFRFFLGSSLARAIAYDLSGASVDSFKVALYLTGATPDQNVATDVLTGYNGAASQWVVANEASGTNYVAGGFALVAPIIDLTTSAGIVFWDANDTSSAASTTVTAVFGCLVYDDTLVNKPGITFNYFGGTQSVTAGVFTVVWNANGIFRFTI